MDAFSTAASATALVGTCAYIARGLSNIRKKLKRMDVTVGALATECWLRPATFGHVARIIKQDTDAFNSKFGSSAANDTEPVAAGLKNAIDCATMLMAQLQGFLDKCNEKTTDGSFSLSSKASYLWTEADVKDVLETVRRLAQGVGTLLTIMQSESLAGLQEKVNANAEALKAIASQTRESYVANVKESSRKVNPSNTGGTENSGTASYYEDELIKSTVYKRAFHLRSKSKAALGNTAMRRSTAYLMDNSADFGGASTISGGSQLRRRTGQVDQACSMLLQILVLTHLLC